MRILPTDDERAAIRAAIFPVQAADLDEIVALHERHVTYGFGVRPDFEALLASADTVGYKFVENGEIGGFTMFRKGLMLSSGHPEIIQKLEHITGDAPTYTGDSFIVKPQYRRRGIGAELDLIGVSELARRGVKYLLMELWVHDGIVPAGFVTERYSKIHDIGLFKNFYTNYHTQGFICTVCGKDCHCAAHIYLCKLQPEGV